MDMKQLQEFWERFLADIHTLIMKENIEAINNLISENENKSKIEELKKPEGVPPEIGRAEFNLTWNKFEEALQNKDIENIKKYFPDVKKCVDEYLIYIEFRSKK